MIQFSNLTSEDALVFIPSKEEVIDSNISHYKYLLEYYDSGECSCSKNSVWNGNTDKGKKATGPKSNGPSMKKDPENEKVRLSNLITKQDSEGDSFLFLAIIAKRTDIVMEIVGSLTSYMQLRSFNNFRQTCLHLASVVDDHAIIRRLMVAGAEVSRQDWKGNTPLHTACLHGYRQGVETLLRPITYIETKLNGYDTPYQQIPQQMEIRNFSGETCLLIAVTRKDTEIANLLLDVDADINTIDLKTGKTCLHIAAEMGDIGFLKFVLSKRGIVLNARTYAGYTATELAYYRNHFNAVFVLRCEGASRPRAIDFIEPPNSDSD